MILRLTASPASLLCRFSVDSVDLLSVVSSFRLVVDLSNTWRRKEVAIVVIRPMRADT